MSASLVPANKEAVMRWLEDNGREQTRKVFRRHGAREPFYGVRVGDLKKVLKGHRDNTALAIALWETGNSDAMYLAALMANAAEMSAERLRQWMSEAYWYMLSEVSVAGLAAEGAHGWRLGLEWIASESEMVATGGWGTLASWISLRDDGELDVGAIRGQVRDIGERIHGERNRVRYTMNNYVICVASYVRELHEEALEAARAIGEVKIDMGGTSCKVPLASQYIEKIAQMGRVGRKRKHARC